jgi:hypothetical protein
MSGRRHLFVLVALATSMVPRSRAAHADEPTYADVTEAEVAPKGVTTPPLPRELEQRFAGKTVSVAYEIYLAPDAHITKIEPTTSVPEVDDVVRKWLLTWFKPTAPERYVRFPVHFTYTIAPAGYQPPPPHMMAPRLIAGDRPSLPDEVKRRNAGKQLVGVFIVSIGRDGHVTAVEPKVSIPGADAAIMAAIKSWRYEPLPVPVRRAERLVYDIVEPRFR